MLIFFLRNEKCTQLRHLFVRDFTPFPPLSSRAKRTTIFGRRGCFWDARNTTTDDDDGEGRGGGIGSKNDTNEAKASARQGRIVMATRNGSSEYF